MKKTILLLIFALGFSIAIANTEEVVQVEEITPINQVEEVAPINRSQDREKLIQERNRLQQELQERRENLIKQTQERLEQVKEVRNQLMNNAREEFQQRLEQVKSERARQLASQLETRLNNASDKITDAFINVLARMKEISYKMEDRTNLESLPLVDALQEKITALEGEAMALKAEIITLEFDTPDDMPLMFRQQLENRKQSHQNIRTKINELREEMRLVWEQIK